MTRQSWINRLTRIVELPLARLAEGTLQASLPPRPAWQARTAVAETLARTLLGLAPWLELGAEDTSRLAGLARQAIGRALDPTSPDCLDFGEHPQMLVEAALLVDAFLLAPGQLWAALPAGTQAQVVAAVQRARVHVPYYNNWWLFAALVEVWLASVGAAWDAGRVDLALRTVHNWYAGDGWYSDGPEFHFDYYNSLVIHPLLADTLDTLERLGAPYRPPYPAIRHRQRLASQRHALTLERLVAPDGVFPPVGRSLTYRCGVFHLLAKLALQDRLPPGLPPAQVCLALERVMQRTLDAPGTFTPAGWLAPGLAGCQPSLQEVYISPGSLYACTWAFLPLGLPPEHPFWAAGAPQSTAQALFSGLDLSPDHFVEGL